jgi:predicted DNA-binding ribbon-helix-helix protein
MKSPVVKRSIEFAGRETSVSLEDVFWNRLRDIARQRRMTLSDLVATIDSRRQHPNLSSALRVFVLDFYYSQKHEVTELPPEEVPFGGVSDSSATTLQQRPVDAGGNRQRNHQ